MVQGKLMNSRWTIHLLALLGVVATVIYQVIMKSNVNDATFDGGPFSKSEWIWFTIFQTAWFLVPYLILAGLNKSQKNMYKHPRMLISLVIVILFIAVYLMMDIAVFHPVSLGAVVMVFWVPIQTVLLVSAWGACK